MLFGVALPFWIGRV